MITRHKYIFYLLSIVFIVSCKKESTQIDTDSGYGYFPNTAGAYVIYDVDSTVYDDFENDTDVYRFLSKEVIESHFYDNEGRLTQRIERYVKNYDSTQSYDSIPWTLKDVWTANIGSARAEKMEENIRYVKLIFPVSADKTWNGNAYNTLGEQEYKYVSVNEPMTLNAFNFDSTLTVEQLNVDNFVEKKYYTEKYAKNIGMVYKEIIDVYSGTIIPLVPVTDRIEKGFKMKMNLVSYGM